MTRDRLSHFFGYNEALGKECPLAWKSDHNTYRVGDSVPWHLRNGYARAGLYGLVIPSKVKFIYIHRIVCLLNSDYKSLDQVEVVDHIDNDPLNNFATNLRFVSHSQNLRNQPKREGATSRYWGVFYDCHNRFRPWRAHLQMEGRRYHIGSYADEEVAAIAYDQFLIDMLGREGVLRECFSLNFPLTHGIEEGTAGVPQIIEHWCAPPRPQLEMETPLDQGQHGVYVIKPSGKRLSKDRQLELW